LALKFNFSSIRHIILKDRTPLHLHNHREIKREHGSVVLFQQKSKVVFKLVVCCPMSIPCHVVTDEYNLARSKINTEPAIKSPSFQRMTPMLQHPFTHIVAELCGRGKSMVVVKFLSNREKHTT
jgi:hypothetical protein